MLFGFVASQEVLRLHESLLGLLRCFAGGVEIARVASSAPSLLFDLATSLLFDFAPSTTFPSFRIGRYNILI
ncbi:hypothetical protein KFK09_025907 [Dendrobium nobile]|uniref:Uncharacterized protein n=2 Tax=Dendrobium nobile TaxID=94219 RepID=A0A8T3A553_DENNO|nr:hypothetical protein KFK09_025907 [Dendrobium nobile]